MIIILAPSDATIIATARLQSFNFPETYGAVYIMGRDQVPLAGETENVFFSGHALVNGSTGGPEIGEENGDLAMSGLELWENFKRVFPDQYQGDVFVDACESADNDTDMFSLIEQFRSQSDLNLDSTAVYGRTGSPAAGDPIPPPGDEAWVEPGE
jgi:hypothetical protein